MNPPSTNKKIPQYALRRQNVPMSLLVLIIKLNKAWQCSIFLYQWGTFKRHFITTWMHNLLANQNKWSKGSGQFSRIQVPLTTTYIQLFNKSKWFFDKQSSQFLLTKLRKNINPYHMERNAGLLVLLQSTVKKRKISIALSFWKWLTKIYQIQYCF